MNFCWFGVADIVNVPVKTNIEPINKKIDDKFQIEFRLINWLKTNIIDHIRVAAARTTARPFKTTAVLSKVLNGRLSRYFIRLPQNDTWTCS